MQASCFGGQNTADQGQTHPPIRELYIMMMRSRYIMCQLIELPNIAASESMYGAPIDLRATLHTYTCADTQTHRCTHPHTHTHARIIPRSWNGGHHGATIHSEGGPGAVSQVPTLMHSGAGGGQEKATVVQLSKQQLCPSSQGWQCETRASIQPGQMVNSRVDTHICARANTHLHIIFTASVPINVPFPFHRAGGRGGREGRGSEARKPSKPSRSVCL